MTMEMIHFKVEKIIDIENLLEKTKLKEEIVAYKNGYHWLVVNKHVKHWMNKNNYPPQFIKMEKVCDMEKIDKLNPDLKGFHYIAWNFNSEKSMDNWVEMCNFDTNEVITLRGNAIAYSVLPIIYLKVTEVGMIGRPFVENFDKVYTIMEQYNTAQVPFANIDIFDLNIIQALEPYNMNKDLYKTNFCDNWDNNSFVNINW